MPTDSAWNMYIFRDGKTVLRGSELVSRLATRLAQYDGSAPSARTKLVDLLLSAGELECALADSPSVYQKPAEEVTDALAQELVSGIRAEAGRLAKTISAIELDGDVRVADTEGFAFYALHPLDYAELARSVASQSRLAAVIGIRSIGTTLSAVVQAALCANGVKAERTTVRPTGHPYNRETAFTDEQKRWLATMRLQHAVFFVVDEGPGLSGSSFLSVGDALFACGVPRHSIVFLCSRHPDPASLTSRDAASRWPCFQASYKAPTKHLPPGATHYIAGGIWRGFVFEDENDWPASWLQMERLKFLSTDRRLLFKFEGYGRHGEEVHDRACIVGDAGFGPRPASREEGFGVYPWLPGRYLTCRDAGPAVLARLAAYCAFRQEHIPARTHEGHELECMLRFNFREEFGIDLPEDRLRLAIVRPTVADGRMPPHKWMNSDRAILKLDSASHGDDHFFPGPCDIAWDLAGTIVEWDLTGSAKDFFLHKYLQHSGDDCRDRLPNYILAYSIFRTAYSRMAAAAMRGAPEEHRLRADYTLYRGRTARFLSENANRMPLPMPRPSPSDSAPTDPTA